MPLHKHLESPCFIGFVRLGPLGFFLYVAESIPARSPSQLEKGSSCHQPSQGSEIRGPSGKPAEMTRFPVPSRCPRSKGCAGAEATFAESTAMFLTTLLGGGLTRGPLGPFDQVNRPTARCSIVFCLVESYLAQSVPGKHHPGSSGRTGLICLGGAGCLCNTEINIINCSAGFWPSPSGLAP